VHYVLRRVFYAMEDTRTPFFITVFQAILFVAGALLVAMLPTSLIAVGLAVVTSIAAAAQALLAFVIVRRRIGSLDVATIVCRHLTFLGATVPAAGVGLVVVWALGGFSGGFAVSDPKGALTTLVAAGVPMVAIYAGILLAVKNPEAVGIVSPVLRRLRRR
jgi:putative peptidoglycan lipid II flippase